VSKNSPKECVVRGRFTGGGIYQPRETDRGEKYSANVVLLDDKEAEKIRDIRQVALEEVFEGKVPKKLRDWTLRKGADEDFEASYGHLYINAKSSADKKLPVLRRVEGKLEPTEDVYPGCYVNVSVTAFAYPGDAKKKIDPGVTLSLNAVMFWKDGERIGGGFDESSFDNFDSEADEESFGEEAEALL